MSLGWATRVAVVLLVVLAEAGPCGAWTQIHSLDGSGTRWMGGRANPIPYEINATGAKEGFEESVRQAFDTWSGVDGADVAFKYLGPTERKGMGLYNTDYMDGHNVVFWNSGASPDPIYGDVNDPDTLAVTLVISRDNGPRAGEITEFDIEFNGPGFAGVKTDVRTVALHEIGHALGFDHEERQEFVPSVLQPRYGGPNQELFASDIAGLKAVYAPKDSLPPAPAGISDASLSVQSLPAAGGEVTLHVHVKDLQAPAQVMAKSITPGGATHLVPLERVAGKPTDGDWEGAVTILPNRGAQDREYQVSYVVQGGTGRVTQSESAPLRVLPGNQGAEATPLPWTRQKVTRGLTSPDADQSSQNAGLTSDGRFLGFFSSAGNLVEGDVEGWQDVFLKDLQTGETRRVSCNATGEGGDALSGYYTLSLSNDGRYVAFDSAAHNLLKSPVAGTAASDAAWQLYRKDMQTGEVTLISSGASGEPGNGGSSICGLSADGALACFVSEATNLVPGDTNGKADVFLKDLKTGQVTRLNGGGSGQEADGGSTCCSISADGRLVVFDSEAKNLVAGVTRAGASVYSRNLATGQLSCVSVNAEGKIADSPCSYPQLSADGTKVLFLSTALTLVPGSNGDEALYVKDLTDGSVVRVASAPATSDESFAAVSGAGISGNGRFVAYRVDDMKMDWATFGISTTTSFSVKDLKSGAVWVLESAALPAGIESSSNTPVLNWDGRVVAWDTGNPWLVTDDTNSAKDIFIATRPDVLLIAGDVTGDLKVGIPDVLLLLRAVAGMAALDDTQRMAADLNGDGKLGVDDAVALLRRVAGL